MNFLSFKNIIQELKKESLLIKYLGDDNLIINKLFEDSRKVTKGGLFLAISGYKTDGHNFINSAIDKGASVILMENNTYKINSSIKAYIIVSDSRKSLAVLARLFYKNPSSKLHLTGITGTNGKTSVSYMIREILHSSELKVGLIGTIFHYSGNCEYKSVNTTPSSLVIYELLNEMFIAGVSHVVMEISSHALYLDRVYGLNFDIMIFTNLTEDHLDFHKNMNSYLLVKLKSLDLLAQSSKKTLAILNNDDLKSQIWINRAKNLNLKYKLYGLNSNSDFFVKDICLNLRESSFIVCNKEKNIQKLKIPLPGRFNIYNALSAYISVLFTGIKLEIISKGFAKINVPGRFQLIHAFNGALIIVDYAHTPDALKNVFETVKELNFNRMISVFGCGGDRDKKKRELMGIISGTFCNLSIITNDNPRSENPNKIIQRIKIGLNNRKASYIEIQDRYEAILLALKISFKNDIILILGKGHETDQILKDKTIHFSDVETVKNILSNKF